MVCRLQNQLSELAGLDVGHTAFSEPLVRHSSWKIGGPADLLIEPQTIGQVGTIVRYARQRSIPLVVIGQGTNLLFDDAGVRGIVLKIGQNMAGCKITADRIFAGAGVWVPLLARQAMVAGLAGLEHCIGIPGTLGGLVMMNGGSHRQGIGENVAMVTVVDSDGQLQKLTRAECDFSYRHSSLQDGDAIVVAVELQCGRGDSKKIRKEMLRDLRERRHKFPRKRPNCGSVFLSSSEMHETVGPPGKIIESLGLKGTRIGEAEVSQQHANFIINRGSATAKDTLFLIARIRQAVHAEIGFDLQCEVRYVSPQGEVAPAHHKADKIFYADSFCC